MTMPKISIITVTFNSEKTLRRAMDSVLGQEYENFEYIIVDGGSTDGTVDIIRSYKDKVTRWISEPDKGISDAFNKGIAMATGDIIGLINSDDGLMPDALRYVADSYDSDTDVYFGQLVIWDEKSNTRVIDTPSLHYNHYDANHICHPSMFVAKKAYDRYGIYDVSCKYVMDYELILRFQRLNAKFRLVPEPLAFFTLGATTTIYGYSRERLKETELCIRRNGASNIDVGLFYSIKGIKWAAKKVLQLFVSNRTVLKIRYKTR